MKQEKMCAVKFARLSGRRVQSIWQVVFFAGVGSERRWALFISVDAVATVSAQTVRTGN